MNNTLKLLTAAAVLSIAPAAAQTAGPLGDTVSAAEVMGMLSDFDIATELRATQPGASPNIIATTAGGAKFLIGFFDCAEAAKPAGCKQVMVSTAQSSGGVEFDDLNSFNGQSSVTTVVYEPSSQILIFGRNIFMPGGIGRDNFKLQVALFLGDMQKFVEGRKASAKSVAFTSPKLKTKIDGIAAEGTGAEPKALAISHDRSAEVEIAIANSLDVDYAIKKD